MNPPLLLTRELLNPTEYEPPVGTNCETPKFQIRLLDALAWTWLLTGVLLLCLSRSAVVNQSKIP